jgi:hypothetical protein
MTSKIRAYPWALPLVYFFILTGLILPPSARAESLGDNFSNISPALGPGGGEYVHGQKQGKILIRVLVFGSVGSQGIHYVPEGTDLLFAILYAGGYTDSSKLSGITIRRKNVKDVIDVDLEDLIADGKEVPKLIDGDVITVPYNWRRDITTITMITSFISSMTAFTLSVIALTRH